MNDKSQDGVRWVGPTLRVRRDDVVELEEQWRVKFGPRGIARHDIEFRLPALWRRVTAAARSDATPDRDPFAAYVTVMAQAEAHFLDNYAPLAQLKAFQPFASLQGSGAVRVRVDAPEEPRISAGVRVRYGARLGPIALDCVNGTDANEVFLILGQRELRERPEDEETPETTRTTQTTQTTDMTETSTTIVGVGTKLYTRESVGLVWERSERAAKAANTFWRKLLLYGLPIWALIADLWRRAGAPIPVVGDRRVLALPLFAWILTVLLRGRSTFDVALDMGFRLICIAVVLSLYGDWPYVPSPGWCLLIGVLLMVVGTFPSLLVRPVMIAGGALSAFSFLSLFIVGLSLHAFGLVVLGLALLLLGLWLKWRQEVLYARWRGDDVTPP